jgi:hypothetical protein
LLIASPVPVPFLSLHQKFPYSAQQHFPEVHYDGCYYQTAVQAQDWYFCFPVECFAAEELLQALYFLFAAI